MQAFFSFTINGIHELEVRYRTYGALDFCEARIRIFAETVNSRFSMFANVQKQVDHLKKMAGRNFSIFS